MRMIISVDLPGEDDPSYRDMFQNRAYDTLVNTFLELQMDVLVNKHISELQREEMLKHYQMFHDVFSKLTIKFEE